MPTDLAPLSRIYGEPEVMRYIGSGKPLSEEDTWRHTAFFLGHWQLRGYGMFAVEEKKSGSVIGRIGLHYPDGWPDIEIGWLLAREAWGQGYAQEGASAVIHQAFQPLKLTRLVSLIHADNHPSIRLAQRLGEELKETITLSGQSVQVYELNH